MVLCKAFRVYRVRIFLFVRKVPTIGNAVYVELASPVPGNL